MTTSIPAAVQHAVLILATALLAWGAQVVPTIDGLPVGVRDVLAAVAAWLIGYALPAFDNYGLGKAPAPAQEAV